MPASTSGESDRVYQRRTKQRHHAVRKQRRLSIRSTVIVVLVVLAIVALAVWAGTMAFRGTVGSSLALQDSDADKALVAAEAEKASYTLIAADLGSVAAPLDQPGPDVLLLARLDEQSRSVALIEIPSTLQVTLSDGEIHHLYEAEGDAALIGAVSKFANVPVSHFVKIDEDGFVELVDALGGIEVDVTQTIDDPHAGDVFIPIGTHVLNGRSALTYLRASNLKQGEQDQKDNQLDFAARLVEAVFSGDGGGFESRVETIGQCIQTDYPLGDLADMAKWVSGVPASSIVRVRTPGYTTATSGVVDAEVSYFVASSDGLKPAIAALDEGRDPESDKAAAGSAVDPASFTIEVQNGTDITGAASVTGDLLAGKGFSVKTVGNAEQQVYDETLVVYKGDDGEARANAVIEALGNGRAVSAGYYYDFKTDILVILGADYKPTS